MLNSARTLARITHAESATAPDGETRTFVFVPPIIELRIAFVGGVAQLPGDCEVVAGNLVFKDSVTPPISPEDDRVSALYFQ